MSGSALPGALGLGIGWREAISGFVLHRSDLGFVEVVAERHPSCQPLPGRLVQARERGLKVVPHGVALSLGGASPPDPGRLAELARLAERVEAPLVSEHIAFVRAGGLEAGHLLPVPRTRLQLDVLCENVRLAQAALPVPLALEPVASLFEWPNPELDEADFLTELVERTGALLLLDVANLYANARNGATPAADVLARLPLDRVAYVHVAGGVECGGLYHDTHAHDVPDPVLALLEELYRRQAVPGVMLERDDRFPGDDELHAELDALARSARRGMERAHARV